MHYNPTLNYDDLILRLMEYSSLSEENYEWFVHRYNRFVKENGHEEVIIKGVLPEYPEKNNNSEYYEH